MTSSAEAIYIDALKTARKALQDAHDAHGGHQISLDVIANALSIADDARGQADHGEASSYSPTIVDQFGIADALADVIHSQGHISALSNLYALVDAWGEKQRQHASSRTTQLFKEDRAPASGDVIYPLQANGAVKPFGYFHELLDSEGNTQSKGIWLGCADKSVTERSYVKGETGEDVFALYAVTPAESIDAARYRLLRCYQLSGSWPQNHSGVPVSAFGSATLNDVDMMMDEALGLIPPPFTSTKSLRKDYYSWRQMRTTEAIASVTHSDNPHSEGNFR